MFRPDTPYPLHATNSSEQQAATAVSGELAKALAVAVAVAVAPPHNTILNDEVHTMCVVELAWFCEFSVSSHGTIESSQMTQSTRKSESR